MKIKNANYTCSTLRSFQRIFAQQAARGRLSTAVNIVTSASGSVVMPLASVHSVPVGALRQKTFQRFDVGVSLSILRQSVQDTLQTLGRLNFPHQRGSPHWPRFGPLPPRPFLKPSLKRPSSVTGANIHWSSTPMMNCPLLSASRKRARVTRHAVGT